MRTAGWWTSGAIAGLLGAGTLAGCDRGTPPPAEVAPGVGMKPGAPPPKGPSSLSKAAALPMVPKGPRHGGKSPAFEAKADDGKTYKIGEIGGTLVLFFYPKDDTPGCTLEAQEFRDELAAFAKKGAIVLGASLDTPESHKAFREKHKLNFPLVLDGAALAKTFEVPIKDGMAARRTFVIGIDGTILRIFEDVNPKGHAAEILELL